MLWTVVLEKTLESPLDCKEIQPVHSEGDQSWLFIGRTDSLEKTLMLGKIEAGREGDDRGWDGRMASSTWWTWAWASSRIWWWTWKPGVLQSMGSQRVGHDWATELNWSSIANQFTPSSIFSITWYIISPFEEIVGSINNKIKSLLCCSIRFTPKVILWLKYSKGY